MAAAGKKSHPRFERKWRIAGGDSLLQKDWAQDTTVYSRLTGETHLLSALPAEVLRMLTEGEKSEAELAAAMGVLCEVTVDEGWLNDICKILQRLEALFLVEPVD